MACALLLQAGLSNQFWGDAILASAYLINQTPTPILHGKTPYEKLFNTVPNDSHLRVLVAYVLFPPMHKVTPNLILEHLGVSFLDILLGKRGIEFLI
jgi:hypothetical protein